MKQVEAFFVGDFTCPFSYVTEAALCRWEAENEMGVRRVAYELYPPEGEVAAPPAVEALPEAFSELCSAADLLVRSPSHRPRTSKAHEASRFARSAGREPEMRRAMYRAYFERDLDLSRIDVLAACGEKAGLDATDLRIALDIDRFTSVVRAEEAHLRGLGIDGTPWILPAPGKSIAALGGARSYEEIDAHLKRIVGA